MKKIVFTEEFCQPQNLFPFTLTRQIQDIRMGVLTIREKWEQYMGLPSADKYEDDFKDLDRAFHFGELEPGDIIYLVHGNVLPSAKLVRQVKKLSPGQLLTLEGKENFVYCISKEQVLDQHKIRVEKSIASKGELREILYPWDIFKLNAWAIREDFSFLKDKVKGVKVSKTNNVTNSGNILIEKGAQVEHCFLNASEGPIYVGKNALVMEGSMLRGPIAICEGAVVKMGTRIYGGTTIGPHCTVGGEIKNAVLFGNSNKAHDGYLGDSVIGEWCNLGAGTTNSNVKNNASDILVYTLSGSLNVGQKCGVIMGDYSRTAINTTINTGTVIGVSCNVFGAGLTPKYVPSFSWGSEGIQRYEFDKALDHIGNWKSMKGAALNQQEKHILKHIFDHY